jgi:RNA recognition motif-containing protein
LQESRASPTSAGKCRREADAECKLFVGGIKPETTSEDLREHFSKYGSVHDAVAMMGKERPRGFGFVTFDTRKAAKSAMCNKHWLHDRLLDVKWAVPRDVLKGASSPCGLPDLMAQGFSPRCSARRPPAVVDRKPDGWKQSVGRVSRRG